MTIPGKGRIRNLEALTNSLMRQGDTRGYQSRRPLEIEPCTIIRKDGGVAGPPSTWTYTIFCLTNGGTYTGIGVGSGLRLTTVAYTQFTAGTIVPVNFFQFIPVIMVAEPGSAADVIVQLTSNASGGGKYNGQIYTGQSTAIGTGNEAQPEGMNGDGNAALVLNLDEDGLPTHWLKIGTYVVGTVVGATSDDPPVSIVTIPCGFARIASPQALASGTGDTAQTDTWNRAVATSGSAYGDIPVSLVASRIVYNSSGNEILYKMERTLTFAADGRLASITAETRVTVNTPEEETCA